MEKYLGYQKETISQMIRDRQVSLQSAIKEMFEFPMDGTLYERAQYQAQELAELINEWTFRNDEQIK